MLDDDLITDIDEVIIDDDLDVVDADDDLDSVADVLLAETPDEEEAEDDDSDIVELKEESDEEEVEEALDIMLRDKLDMRDEVGSDDEEESDVFDDTVTRIVPRRANEFLCTSCFLVLPKNLLADEARQICRDCI